MAEHILGGSVVTPDAPLATELTAANIAALQAALEALSLDFDADSIAALAAALNVAIPAGTALIGKVGFDTSVSAAVSEASAAVDAAGSTVCNAQATGGKRYDRVTVNCDNTHTVKFYGAAAHFALIANGYLMPDYTKTGLAAVSGNLGNSWLIDVSGFAFVSCVADNEGADASTIPVTHIFLD